MAPHLHHVFGDADPPPLMVVDRRSLGDGGIGDPFAQILKMHRLGH
jgi:hypothetical protein